MANYFNYFPKINYNGKVIRDISRRTRLIDDLRSKPYVFLPYTVEDGERPEDIAHLYYGSVNYTWLVMMCNNIVDPYEDWYMPSDVFERYIIKKYAAEYEKAQYSTFGSIEWNYTSPSNGYDSIKNAIGFDILHWTQDTTTTDNVKHYENKSTGDIISKYTYELNVSDNAIVSGFEASDWNAVRYYDYEYTLNESRREIELIDSRYAESTIEELRELLNAG